MRQDVTAGGGAFTSVLIVAFCFLSLDKAAIQ